MVRSQSKDLALGHAPPLAATVARFGPPWPLSRPRCGRAIGRSPGSESETKDAATAEQSSDSIDEPSSRQGGRRTLRSVTQRCVPGGLVASGWPTTSTKRLTVATRTFAVSLMILCSPARSPHILLQSTTRTLLPHGWIPGPTKVKQDTTP